MEQFKQISVLILFASLSACAPGGSNQNASDDGVGITDGEIYRAEKPLWDNATPDGVFWSAFSYQLVGGGEIAPVLLPGSDDIADFCPNYSSLPEALKINFWVYLVSAIAKYESDFNPLSRYEETSLGTDDVTGGNVFSEGLLQLSYQDVKHYKFCRFDWQADKKLAPDDPKKTILDPLLNLDCGIRILAQQIEKKKDIAINSGAYWSVLKKNGARSRLTEITALTKALPFCK